MYNKTYVLAGILIFVALFTLPFWAGYTGGKYKSPELKLPADSRECIESVEYMRAEHMQLLNDWRDHALRDEARVYVSSTGKKWEISLQNTCMKCHDNKAEFCDKCHLTNSVDPYCWTCHIEPKGNK